MKNRDTDRPLQRLVPAGKCGDERACAEPLNSLIPADEQDGSPAPVESPSDHETLVPLAEFGYHIARALHEVLLARGIASRLDLSIETQTANTVVAGLVALKMMLERANDARGTGGNSLLNKPSSDK